MKAVVTGATGFVGQPLCRLLRGGGHEVTALSRDAAKAQTVLGPDVVSVAWGGGADNGWKRAVQEADVVIHLAGESVAGQRWTPEFKGKIRRSRVETTRSLVDAMQEGERRPGAFLCASAVGYYGDRGDETLTETSPPGKDFLAEVCVEWEAEALKAQTLGVRVVSVRIGFVLGRGGGLQKMLTPIPGLPFSPWKLGLGGPMGSGRQWVPWVHLDDVAGIFFWAATTPTVAGIVNAASPNPVRNADFARAIGRVWHRPALLPLPAFALKALLGEFAATILGGQRVLPAETQKQGYAFRYADLGSALQAILTK